MVIVRCLVSFLLMLCASHAYAELQATVDRNPVAVNESFNLILRSDASGGEPRLDVLQKDFEILGQSSSSNIRIFNGKSSRSMQWTIQLMAKRSGSLTVPPIKIGNESSSPVAMIVRETPTDTSGKDKGNLFIEVTATPQDVYVQQQVVLTVRLYYAAEVGRGSVLTDPEFSIVNPMMQRIDEDRQFHTTRNGREYGVIERRYALFIAAAGTYSGGTVTFDGGVIEEGGGSGIFGFDSFGTTRRVRIKSNAVTLNVRPIPEGLDASSWLPSSQLQLQEQWSDNPAKLTVGEPITRTLIIKANDALSAQLPPIDNGIGAGFKSYPDQPALKDEKAGNALRAVREQKFAIIPTQSGTLTLPAIEVEWWNTRENRLETARIAERSVAVLPGSGAPAAPNLGAPSSAITANDDAQSASPSNLLSSEGLFAEHTHWRWIALVLGGGWLLTIILWWLRSKRRFKHSDETVRERAAEQSARRIRQQIKSSCSTNDAAKVKPHLLEWAKQTWQHDPPNSLTAIARRCDPALAKALLELDQMLYSTKASSWSGMTLWGVFEKVKPNDDDVVASAERVQALKPIHEHLR